METDTGFVLMRMRIPASRWGQLKERAGVRSVTPAQYADLIFWYPLPEDTVAPRARSMDDPDEDLYVELELPSRTKSFLAGRSHRLQISLASFAGLLIETFLERFETDPRDLRMMHLVSAQLRPAGLLAEPDLVSAIERCDTNAGVKLPPGYYGKWLFARLRPMVAAIERNGESVPLTQQLLDEVLRRRVQ